jgi:hypothetical protein
MAPFIRLRFHDLRHSAITKLAKVAPLTEQLCPWRDTLIGKCLSTTAIFGIRLNAQRFVSNEGRNPIPCTFACTSLDDRRPISCMLLRDWSGREDSNLRPPGPEPGALPG